MMRGSVLIVNHSFCKTSFISLPCAITYIDERSWREQKAHSMRHQESMCATIQSRHPKLLCFDFLGFVIYSLGRIIRDLQREAQAPNFKRVHGRIGGQRAERKV